jgi:protein CpxP
MPVDADRTQREGETTMTTPNTTRNRRWSWLLALPLAGALAFPAVNAIARPGGGPEAGEFGHFGARHMGKLLDAAGASDAQRTQIKNSWGTLRPQLQALREQRIKLQADVRKALTAPTIDTAAVERLRQQGVQLADKASALVTQGMVQTAQVLTPEQRQKVAAQLAQHPEQGRHHRGE